jgi:Domain of unknown function (DUF5666)
MTATTQQHRLTRLAILAVTGAATVSLAGCGNSSNENTGKPSTSASSTISSPKPPPPPAPPVGRDEVEGLVRSVSGNTIQLTQRDRTPASVDFTPSTMVTELSSAALTDVKPGSCVDVKAASQSGPPGGAITAESVEISPSEGGKCPPPVGPAESPSVNGIVDSVTGNTIAVNGIDPTGKATHTTVTVINTTTYTKHAVTNAQAIQNGKCLAAQGTKDGGVLHAATIDLEPCSPMGRPHHHFHIPIPHHRH